MQPLLASMYDVAKHISMPVNAFYAWSSTMHSNYVLSFQWWLSQSCTTADNERFGYNINPKSSRPVQSWLVQLAVETRSKFDKKIPLPVVLIDRQLGYSSFTRSQQQICELRCRNLDKLPLHTPCIASTRRERGIGQWRTHYMFTHSQAKTNPQKQPHVTAEHDTSMYLVAVIDRDVQTPYKLSHERKRRWNQSTCRCDQIQNSGA